MFLRNFGTLCLIGLLLVALACVGARLLWILDLFTHASVYWFAASLVALAALLFARAWRRALLGVALCAFFGWEVVPYFVPRGGGGSPASLRVVHLNLLNGNSRHGEVRDYLLARDPDLLVLQELDPRWRSELTGIIDRYPHRVLEVRRGADGMALLSRFPLSDVRMHDEHGDRFPSFAATLDSGEVSMRVFAVHPPPPVRLRSARMRDEALARVTELAAQEERPIVIGDLNCSPWSPHFRQFRRRAGLRDAALGAGLVRTWFPTRLPLGIPIDHVLVPRGVTVENFEVGPDLGSDHRALSVDLSFR